MRDTVVKILAVILLILFFLIPAAIADGKELRLSSNTHLRGFVKPGAQEPSTHLPFYELVRLRALDLGLEGLSVQAALWGQIEILDVEHEDRATGDVSLLMAEYVAPHKSRLEGLRLRLGRQFVAAGPSILEQLDGGEVSYRLPFGLKVTAFGGAPTGIRFIEQPWPVRVNDFTFGYNWVLGGRLGYSFRDWGGVGVSYRQKRFSGRVAFNEVGWDAVITPVKLLELSGHGVAELTAQRLKEARAGARFHLSRRLEVGAGYRFISPDLFIPRSSIFSVFSDELHQEIYGEATWSPWRWLSLSAEAGARLYGETCTDGPIGGASCDAAEAVVTAEARADLRLGAEGRYRVTVEAERAGAPEQGYTRARVACAAPVWRRLSAVADIDLFLLDHEEEGHEHDGEEHATSLSFSGSAYLTYALRPDLTILAGGQVMASPLFSSAGAFMVRLSWILDLPHRPRGTAAVKVERSSLSSSSLSLGGTR